MEFKEGDVVQLKSGGLKMVIEDVYNSNYPTADCQWFSKDGTLQLSSFPVTILKKIKKK